MARYSARQLYLVAQPFCVGLRTLPPSAYRSTSGFSLPSLSYRL